MSSSTDIDAVSAPAPVAAEQTRLSGNMSMVSLVLSVLAFSAPIVTVSGYISYSISAVGQGAPLAFIAATAVLAVFAVGYTTMTKHIARPGAFYAYVTLGLGRVAGVGGAFLATTSYVAILSGVYCFTGVTLSTTIETFGGPTITWWVLSIAVWVLVTVLANFHVELSAKVLSVVMVLEVALVLVFNAFTLGQGGADGLSGEPFDLSAVNDSGMAIALLFAFSTFIGFEATALYRDEVRNPDTTVPRATYLAVGLIGLFYTVSCYTLVVAYGSNAGEVATDDPGNMFNNALTRFVSSGFTDMSLVLVATSAGACLLSSHNVAARYLYNLGADRALPAFLSAVHPRHRSPHRASLTVSALVAVILVPLVAADVDSSRLVGSFSGIGTLGVLFLMVLVSLAVIVWFAREGRRGEAAWKVYAAPGLALLSLTAVVVYAVDRFELLVGGDPGQYLWLLLIPAATLAAGCAVAAYYRKAKPQLYGSLGRAEADVL